MSRLPEIDLLRTVAVLLMIAYHAAYDLAVFYGWNIPVHVGAWKLIAQSAATLFLLLVGISFVLSWHKTPIPKKYLQRGMKIFGLGMLLTIGSYLFDPSMFIRFGILHCIGLTMIVLPFVVRCKEYAILLGIALLPLSIPASVSMLDYYPPLPWSGVVFIGVGIGYFLYVRNPRWREWLPDRRYTPDGLLWPGRNALILYFLHQPIIMAICMMIIGWPR